MRTTMCACAVAWARRSSSWAARLSGWRSIVERRMYRATFMRHLPAGTLLPDFYQPRGIRLRRRAYVRRVRAVRGFQGLGLRQALRLWRRVHAASRAGIERETEGVSLVSTRHSPRQFPLHPYTSVLL